VSLFTEMLRRGLLGNPYSASWIKPALPRSAGAGPSLPNLPVLTDNTFWPAIPLHQPTPDGPAHSGARRPSRRPRCAEHNGPVGESRFSGTASGYSSRVALQAGGILANTSELYSHFAPASPSTPGLVQRSPNSPAWTGSQLK
jgi:hypothetical protein